MRKGFVFLFTVCIFGVFFKPAAYPDTIIMNDGRKIEGTITEEGSDYYSVKIKIGTMKIAKDTVKEIKKLSAEENFLNLGNQYLASSNFDAAIEQYNKAIQANPDYQPAKDGLAKAEKMKQEAEAKKKAELERKQKEASGKKDTIKTGFGLTLDSSGGKITLAAVTAGGQAESVGLKAEDEIIQINDMKVNGKTLDEVTDFLVKSDITSYNILMQRECDLTRKKIDYQKHSFVGVGIFLDAAGNDLVINSVIVGEPADLAGLKSKDRVVSIEGKPAPGMSVDDAANLIGGSESSKLKIAIQRSVELERK